MARWSAEQKDNSKYEGQKEVEMKKSVLRNISINFLVEVIQKLGGIKGAKYFLKTGKIMKKKIKK